MTSFSFTSNISFPLVGLGACTLLLSLIFCCYMWRLKRQAYINRGYKKVKYSKKRKKIQNETCPVCLEDFSPKETVAVCDCQHGFHQKNKKPTGSEGGEELFIDGMASCFEYCKIKLEPKQLKELIEKAKFWALAHGASTRCSSKELETYQHAPFALFPSVFPLKAFEEARSIQCAYNTLMHKVAHDDEFLRKAFENVIKVDEFTRKQWEIYEIIRKEGNKQVEPICLGLFRNDYMLNMKSKQANILSLRDTNLKQIEFNMMAASFGGLASQITDLHRYVLDTAGAVYQPQQIPENCSSKKFAEAMVKAWKLYNNNKAVILYIADETETNIIDQYWIEIYVYQLDKTIKILRHSILEVFERGQLAEDGELMIDGHEVAVAYFRHGYSPLHFPTDKEWDGLLKLARCKAIKSPTIQYQLANTKKIQQELAKPGAVEKYVSNKDDVEKIRKTFAQLYSLEKKDNGDSAIEMAMANPEKYVLKPQREGGGNNLYGADMQIMLEKLRDSDERAAYILMERIFPLPQKNYMLKRGHDSSLQDVIGEFGIYSVYIGTESEEIENQECGHVLRTKTEGTDEGGVMTGYSVIDTPFLVS